MTQPILSMSVVCIGLYMVSSRLLVLGFNGSIHFSFTWVFKGHRPTLHYSLCKLPFIPFFFLLVYVDDIIFTGTPGAQFDSLIIVLHHEFAMKDLGLLNYFLGVEATFANNGLYLSQAKYIHDLLSRSSMLECKPVKSLVPLGAHLSSYDGDSFSDPPLSL